MSVILLLQTFESLMACQSSCRERWANKSFNHFSLEQEYSITAFKNPLTLFFDLYMTPIPPGPCSQLLFLILTDSPLHPAPIQPVGGRVRFHARSGAGTAL